MEVPGPTINASSPTFTDTAFGIRSSGACFASGEAFSPHDTANEATTISAANLRVSFMTCFYKATKLRKFHSVLKDFTGFAIEAFTAWYEIVSEVIATTSTRLRPNVHASMEV